MKRPLFVWPRRLADDLVAGRRYGFAFADRTTAGGAEAIPFLKGEAAALALSRFHGEPLRMCGPGDMLEMIENLPLPNPEQLGDLPQVEGFSLDGCGDLLAQSGHKFH
jgi:hypothetical protein